MKNITFPNDFFDFTNGVDCSNGEINLWIRDCFTHIKNEIKRGVKNPHATLSTGNSTVIVSAYLQGNGKYTLDVTVSKAFYNHIEIDVNLNN
jgi:hypothetical protein